MDVAAYKVTLRMGGGEVQCSRLAVALAYLTFCLTFTSSQTANFWLYLQAQYPHIQTLPSFPSSCLLTESKLHRNQYGVYLRSSGREALLSKGPCRSCYWRGNWNWSYGNPGVGREWSVLILLVFCNITKAYLRSVPGATVYITGRSAL